MNGVEITLMRPLSGPLGVIEKVTMRRGKVRDQVAAQDAGGTPAEQEMRLFAFLCGIDPELMNELDLGDYEQIKRTFMGFLKPPEKAQAKKGA